MATKAGTKAGKKGATKLATKSAKKAPAKSSKRPAPKKPTPKKGATLKARPAGAKAAAMIEPKPVGGPFPVVGSSPSAGEIGAAVVAHLRSGATSDTPLWDKYWSDRVESIEGMGMLWRGRKAMEAKCEDWMSKHQVHGLRVEGPFVGASGFAVHMTMDVEEKQTGKRFSMTEVGVYTVEGGRVVREEFMYGGA